MTRPIAVLAALLVAGLAHAADTAPPPRPVGRPLEFIVIDADRVVRARLDVAVGGRPVSSLWDDAFAALLKLYDRDGNGTLDRTEAERLPSAFSLRQVMWGRSAPHTGKPPTWADLDRDGDGAVSGDELAAFYRAAGLGGVSVAVGRSAAADPLMAALKKHLDADGNGTIDAAEWQAAGRSLGRLDRNDDELITPGELVPHLAYPGVAGAAILLPPRTPDDALAAAPVLVLPHNRADTAWAAVLLRSRDRDGDGRLDHREAGLAPAVFDTLDTDRDGELTAGELAGWRALPPDAHWRAEFDAKADAAPRLTAPPPADGRLTVEAGRTQFILRGDPGRLPAAQAAARRRVLGLFAEADADRDGRVAAADLTRRNLYELQQLLAVVDRDGDDRLSAAEVAAWLDVQDRVARAHVLLTVGDFGHGLFEQLDTDHDGGLSVRELDAAGGRAAAVAGQPPRHVLATLARGHPREPLGRPERAGPAWFRAMDRNGDGDVSRREFTGPAAAFDALDTDRDGRLTPAEAERAAK